MRAFLTGLVFTFFTAASALADDQVTTYQLENGMDVVVIEDHRAPACHPVPPCHRPGRAA